MHSVYKLFSLTADTWNINNNKTFSYCVKYHHMLHKYHHMLLLIVFSCKPVFAILHCLCTTQQKYNRIGSIKSLPVIPTSPVPRRAQRTTVMIRQPFISVTRYFLFGDLFLIYLPDIVCQLLIWHWSEDTFYQTLERTPKELRLPFMSSHSTAL